MLGATPARIGALWVCEAPTTKWVRAIPALSFKRRATSETIASETPRLSTVTSTAGPCSSLPIASALAQMGC